LELDKAGRVNVPDRMLQQAGLGNTVTILGVKDHLELRDPQQWKAQRELRLAKQMDIMMRARQALGESTLGGGKKAGP
jgi:DNA-binding transcriptional regulator/RsmH inhibitor MraZ